MTAILPTEAQRRLSALLGQVYEDGSGRLLKVLSVSPGDPDGREVRGQVWTAEDPTPRPYSTSMIIFEAIWVGQAEPWIAPEAVRRGG